MADAGGEAVVAGGDALVRGRISRAQIEALLKYFRETKPPAIVCSKSMKKEHIDLLLKVDTYAGLKRHQIRNQLNAHIMNAQLRMMVGVKMAVATDALLGVTEGAMPDPTTAATLPFARDHTVVILSHLHEFLNHEADGLPCLIPDACMIFLR